MVALADGAALPLAVALGAGPVGCALVAVLPLTIGASAYAAYGPLLRWIRSRRTAVCALVALQAFFLLLVAVVPWLASGRLVALVVILSLSKMAGNAAGPIWSSWIGDIVPERARATFFGRRSRAATFAAIAAAAGGGMLLDDLSLRWSVAAAFSAVYVLAATARLVSAFFLLLHDDPPAHADGDEPGILATLRALPRTHNGPLILYLLWINASVYVCAPYFTPYMIEELGFSYTQLAWVDNAARITKFIFLSVWGRAANRWGPRRTLVLVGPLIAVVPLLWLAHGAFVAIIAYQVFAGFAWAGFELASLALLFDATSRRDRAAVVAAYNVCNGAAILLGSLAGMGIVGAAAARMAGYGTTFAVSGGARLLAMVLLPKIREARAVPSIGYRELLLRVLLFRPTAGPANRPVILPGVAPPLTPPPDAPPEGAGPVAPGEAAAGES